MAKKQILSTTRTSGSKIAADWKDFRERLKDNFHSHQLWAEAYNDYFLERVESRFLAPVRLIKDNFDPQKIGSGFTMVAILCILIEHLQACYEGVVYTTGEPGLYEYKYSKYLFRSFLTTHSPFNSAFKKRDAEKFYDDVRCGLLHEAATKGDALILKDKRGDADTILEKNPDKFIIYRNALHTALESYLMTYRSKLIDDTDTLLRRNLFRKLDELNGVRRSLYFAYGSNLLSQQLESERNIFVHSWHVGRLDGFRITFNKKSTLSEQTYANIKGSEGSTTWGIIYEIDSADFDKLNGYEKGYDRKPVNVILDQTYCSGITYISNSTTVPNPKQEYLGKIIKGAQEKGLPDEWIDFLQTTPIQ